MTDSEFPEALREVIRSCVPNIDAVELLLLLAHEPGHGFETAEVSVKLRPAEVPETLVQKYLLGFQQCGLVSSENGRYRYAPATESRKIAIDRLAKLYNERPVTLVRAIYALKDERIRAFAEAFKLGEP